MAVTPTELSFAGVVDYHYGQFPPRHLDHAKLLQPLSSASAALARYDQMLRNMHNSEILLGPLRRQEAIVSSRIEGTYSTLEEVLRIEADYGEDGRTHSNRHRTEAIEVYLYHRAMMQAQNALEDGVELSSWLLRTTHSTLLSFGRGAEKSPGQFKTEQNYIVDQRQRRVLFTPISPLQLDAGMETLFSFIDDGSCEVLIRTALAHIEFEALHPFKDGNGRIGRMLITLMLWKYGALSAPHYYVSRYLEQHKDEYIERMRNVSQSGEWTQWCIFFLQALEAQANENLRVTEAINTLYEKMKEVFREVLSSQWSTPALDYIFTNPIFRNSRMATHSGIPKQTAMRITKNLSDARLLVTLEPARGRRAALYAFEPLLTLAGD